MIDPAVVSALAQKRAELSSTITDMERRIVTVRADVVHLDATLRLFDPDLKAERASPRASPSKRSEHFGLGELACRCRDVMREAEGQPITTATAVEAIMLAKGLDPADAALCRDFGQRVLGTFYRMVQKGEMSRTGEGLQAEWRLVRLTPPPAARCQ